MRKLTIFIALSIFMVNVCFALPNPAAAYCVQMGYTYNTVKTPHGDTGECVFSATEKCDAWQFLAGTCGQSHSYCLRNGYNIRTASDGKNSYSSQYAICVPKKPSQKERPVSDFVTITENGIPPVMGNAVNSAVSSKSAQASLSSSFDWRNVNGYNWMTPVKDQGQCGSCWDFASVGIMEASMKIDNNNPSSNPDLSEQDILSCNGIVGCKGGTSAVALNYSAKIGVVDEACFPYVGVDANGHNSGTGSFPPVPCSNICSNWQSRKTTVSTVGTIPYGTTGKSQLVSIGPITAYIAIEGTFDSNGIYGCNATNLKVDHSIVLVGYNDAGRYWIAKNSWGSTWNGDGYFKIYYGNCSITPAEYVYVYASTASPTTLTQTVTPPSCANVSCTASVQVKPTFICNYSTTDGAALTNAIVGVTVDGVNYNAIYYPATSDYRYSGVTLSGGNHTWLCSASKSGYASQTNSAQNYYVLPAIIPTGLNQLVTPASGTANGPVTPTFTCNYTSVFNLAVQGATAYVNIDSVQHAATYSSTLYTYVYSGASLSSGNHNWDCSVSKTGYQTQVGPNLVYVVNGPACNSDCTLGLTNVCSASCSGINGCTSFSSVCSNINKGTLKCTDLHDYVSCCNGAVTSCGTTTVSCPPSYCNAAGQVCIYYPQSCSNTCNPATGTCTPCTPSCGTATCITCPNANTICNPNYGKCMQICGKGQPCPN